MKAYLKRIIKSFFGEKNVHCIESFIFSSNLNKLAQIYNTDKYGRHNYTAVYEKFFKKYRYKKINLLEIGVGGYDNPNMGAASLKMWKRYFIKAKIYAIDIYDKSKLEEKRISIFQGSQIDESFLKGAIERIGSINIIIDDGSHINFHIITTFEILFPMLKNGGVYVVEDLQTSYLEEYAGDSQNLNNQTTAMNFFKSLVDAVNTNEFADELIPKKYWEEIESIHFFKKQVFVFKK